MFIELYVHHFDGDYGISFFNMSNEYYRIFGKNRKFSKENIFYGLYELYKYNQINNNLIQIEQFYRYDVNIYCITLYDMISCRAVHSFLNLDISNIHLDSYFESEIDKNINIIYEGLLLDIIKKATSDNFKYKYLFDAKNFDLI